MQKRLTLYSSLWATLLMLFFFALSSLQGVRSGPGRGSLFGSGLRGAEVLSGRVIVLDPGHGGSDPGTVGVGPTTEAANTLAIAWELKGMLERAGAKVIMTRQADLNPAQGTAFGGSADGQLAARVATANRRGGEIFISIHNNWHDNPAVAGTSVYYYKPQDLALAEALQAALVDQIKSVDLGVMYENFYVLRNTNMPAVLVEAGFLSNREEAALLSRPTYRLEVAKGLFYGLINYFKAQS
ncbi:MAG TPA: N-acetylmuramoyl-L-alanine amidase [Firmicutes bacterium]|nr:N-acetylmuramoyl-L-alanine amidase [Bacillota bacterium]